MTPATMEMFHGHWKLSWVDQGKLVVKDYPQHTPLWMVEVDIRRFGLVVTMEPIHTRQAVSA